MPTQCIWPVACKSAEDFFSQLRKRDRKANWMQVCGHSILQSTIWITSIALLLSTSYLRTSADCDWSPLLSAPELQFQVDSMRTCDCAVSRCLSSNYQRLPTSISPRSHQSLALLEQDRNLPELSRTGPYIHFALTTERPIVARDLPPKHNHSNKCAAASAQCWQDTLSIFSNTCLACKPTSMSVLG